MRARAICGGLLAALVLAGCASSSHHAGPSGSTTTAPAPTSTTRPAPLTAQIVLPRRTLGAGSSMAGRLVVENRTGHPLQETGCGSLFRVALTGPRYHPQIAWPQCAQRLTIPTGRSTYRIEVMSSYLACGNGPRTANVPACLPQGGPPPLPVGDYRATLFQSAPVVPAPAPVPVRVTG